MAADELLLWQAGRFRLPGCCICANPC